MKRLTMKERDCKIKNHFCRKNECKRDSPRQQRVVPLQKQRDEAHKQSQEETKDSVGRNYKVAKSDESKKTQSPQQHEEIRELQTNNIVLKDSIDDTEKKLDHVKLRLNRSESQGKRLAQPIWEL